MLSPSSMRTWAPAFASMQRLGRHGAASSLADYKRWLVRVSEREFADELVLAATAELLRVCSVTIPFTPPSSSVPWAISEHPCADRRHELNFSDQQQILLGNDDIHYVCLMARS